MNCYPFIEAEQARQRNFKRGRELLKVSRAACYGAREGPACDRDREDAGLTAPIRAEHRPSKGRVLVATIAAGGAQLGVALRVFHFPALLRDADHIKVGCPVVPHQAARTPS